MRLNAACDDFLFDDVKTLLMQGEIHRTASIVFATGLEKDAVGKRGEGERLRDEILVAARELLAETQDADAMSVRSVVVVVVVVVAALAGESQASAASSMIRLSNGVAVCKRWTR